MGYLVAIRREPERWGSAEISLDEFLAVPLLKEQRIRKPEQHNGGLSFSVEFAKEKRGYIHWKNGEVWSSNPDPEFVQFLVKIADSLEAVVEGDEGEIYLSNGDVSVEKKEAYSVGLKRYGRLIRIAAIYVSIFFAVVVAGLLLKIMLR